jgi:hypothetical protein
VSLNPSFVPGIRNGSTRIILCHSGALAQVKEGRAPHRERVPNQTRRRRVPAKRRQVAAERASAHQRLPAPIGQGNHFDARVTPGRLQAFALPSVPSALGDSGEAERSFQSRTAIRDDSALAPDLTGVWAHERTPPAGRVLDLKHLWYLACGARAAWFGPCRISYRSCIDPTEAVRCETCSIEAP